MPNPLDRLFRDRSPTAVVFTGVVLVALMGGINSRIPREVSFSVFYVPPIALVAWYASRRAAVLLALLSGIVWYAASYIPSEPASAAWIPFWNTAVRGGLFLIVALLTAALRTAIERERVAARVDVLTGLLRAPAFLEAAQAALERARRYARPFTLAYIDADNFKTVNDTAGHTEGDRVLATVGTTLRAQLRAVDVAGRMGGDEFAVLFPESEADGARQALEKIRAVLRSAMAGGGWPVTFSIGAVAFHTAPADLTDVVRHADETMYAVKRSGKDRVEVVAVP
jgi:diguanylate cyclase (GGDEF)-like protein